MPKCGRGPLGEYHGNRRGMLGFSRFMMTTPPPPQRPRPAGSDLSPLARPVDLSFAGLLPSAVPALQTDLEPAQGQWLFKKGDVVLGPVSAGLLVERLQRGEIEGDTPIGREAGAWTRLADVAYFATVLDRVVAERLAREAERAAERERQRERALRAALWALALVLPCSVGVLAGRALATARPWDSRAEWLARTPPIAELPPPPRQAPPTATPRLASASGGAGLTPGDAPAAEGRGGASEAPASGDADEQDADDTSAEKPRTAKSRGKKRKGKSRRDAPASTSRESVAAGALPETLSSEQVTAGLAKGKAGIGACLKDESARNPDMPDVVTLRFTVTEDGSATLIQLREREVRDGPLAACLVNVVSKLRWPRFTGERKNAEVPFRIKR